MCQAHVERILGRLATDEYWRLRYRAAPADAIDALTLESALDVTATERQALLATPAEAIDGFAAAADLRLQRVEAGR